MAYLQPADYPNYGLPAGTTADWITAATALINSYCRRPDLNVIQYTERSRVTGANTDTGASELGLVATTFVDVVISPVVMRKLRPAWQEGGESKWELIVSATSVEQQVNELDLASAQSLFALTLAVTVADQDYLIESIASNEAFGQVYVYRLLLRAAGQRSV